MNYSSPPPCELGETLRGTDANNSAVLINTEFEGKLFWLPANENQTQGVKDRLHSRQVLACLMRNLSGVTIYGKRLVHFDLTSGTSQLGRFDDMTTALAQVGVGALDQFIATNGVAANDLAWVILRGPTRILTPALQASFQGSWAVGDPLCSQIGGSAAKATNTVVAEMYGVVARSLEAKADTAVDEDCLVNMQCNVY